MSFLRLQSSYLLMTVLSVGHIILVASATPHVLAMPDTSMGLLVLAIIIMGIGGGAIKANVSPMIAEQYTGKMRKKTLKSGEVVVVSPAVTYQRIYNWYVLDQRISLARQTYESCQGSMHPSTGAPPVLSRHPSSRAIMGFGPRSLCRPASFASSPSSWLLAARPTWLPRPVALSFSRPCV